MERQRLIHEARRLSKLKAIKDFIFDHCELVDESDAEPPRIYYDYVDRDRAGRSRQLKALIREKLNPAITKSNAPWAWDDVENKIYVLELYVRSEIVPRSMKPWDIVPDNMRPEKPYGGPPDDPGPPDNPGPP